MPEPPTDQPSPHAIRPAEAADDLLRDFEARFAVDEVPPVPVERIAESHLGLLIEEVDDLRSLPNAPTNQGALSGMLDAEAQTIWLDRAEAQRSPGRRRFTIAHECGHWVLHVTGTGLLVCRNDEVETAGDRALRQREAEANAFAEALLMPERLVHEHATSTGCNLPVLAERFDVSVVAMRLRLLRLGLLPPWMARLAIVERGSNR
jgi:IrrE N-terminal-like domain